MLIQNITFCCNSKNHQIVSQFHTVSLLSRKAQLYTSPNVSIYNFVSRCSHFNTSHAEINMQSISHMMHLCSSIKPLHEYALFKVFYK